MFDSVVNVNCVDPDQTPRSAASDLGLNCLQMLVLWDARARHKRVKGNDNTVCSLSAAFLSSLHTL